MKYICPLCKAELDEYMGEATHPNDSAFGVTLDCGNKKCPAQEVMGHGKTADAAFRVIEQKFAGKR